MSLDENGWKVGRKTPATGLVLLGHPMTTGNDEYFAAIISCSYYQFTQWCHLLNCPSYFTV